MHQPWPRPEVSAYAGKESQTPAGWIREQPLNRNRLHPQRSSGVEVAEVCFIGTTQSVLPKQVSKGIMWCQGQGYVRPGEQRC
jgi:hypothetical protein